MKPFVKILLIIAIPIFLLAIGCANRPEGNYKDSVKKALEQSDLMDVTVNEDRDKNTVTLGGKVRSQEAKDRAMVVAKSAAANRIVVNEISLQPVGVESEAKSIASNLDDGIENNYKAVLISNGLDKQHIRFHAKNGVLTLQGDVDSAELRQQAERTAAMVPNVEQVLNEIQIKR